MATDKRRQARFTVGSVSTARKDTLATLEHFGFLLLLGRRRSRRTADRGRRRRLDLTRNGASRRSDPLPPSQFFSVLLNLHDSHVRVAFDDLFNLFPQVRTSSRRVHVLEDEVAQVRRRDVRERNENGVGVVGTFLFATRQKVGHVEVRAARQNGRESESERSGLLDAGVARARSRRARQLVACPASEPRACSEPRGATSEPKTTLASFRHGGGRISFCTAFDGQRGGKSLSGTSAHLQDQSCAFWRNESPRDELDTSTAFRPSCLRTSRRLCVVLTVLRQQERSRLGSNGRRTYPSCQVRTSP